VSVESCNSEVTIETELVLGLAARIGSLPVRLWFSRRHGCHLLVDDRHIPGHDHVIDYHDHDLPHYEHHFRRDHHHEVIGSTR
jgi:hypothetical protein